MRALLDNSLNRGNKQEIIEWGLPDYSAGVTQTMGTEYTAELDGILFVYIQTGANASYVTTVDNETFTQKSYTGIDTIQGLAIPVKQGSKYTPGGNYANIFYPLLGVSGGGSSRVVNYVEDDTPVVINDGVLTSGTINPTVLFAPQNWTTWELYAKIKTGNTVSEGETLFSCATWTRLINVSIYSGGVFQFLASNFNTWIGGLHTGTLVVQPNTTYLIKVGTDGTNFYLKYSTDDGDTWTTDISFSTEGKTVGNYENYQLKINPMGENYLDDMTLTADGVVVWTPFL